MVRASAYDFFDGCFYYDEPVDAEKLLPKARIARDAEMREVGKRRISYSDIDYNMHMNNTHYPDMLCDYLPLADVERIRGISLSYLHEAAYGDRISVWGVKRESGYLFRTFNEKGEVCLEAQIELDPA
jgi:acyl-ACP thioesterase